MRGILYSAMVGAATVTLIWAAPASAQRVTRCYVQFDRGLGIGTDWYATDAVSDEDRSEIVNALKEQKDEIVRKIGAAAQGYPTVGCGGFDMPIGSDVPGYETARHRLFSINPFFDYPRRKKEADGKRLTLHFAPPGYKSGYPTATIDLRYRFLICNDEVQVAYGIDRQSVHHSQKYQPAGKDGPRLVTPAGEPPAPVSVPLNAQVRKGGYALNLYVRDAIAGETLGMGCFTGQTKTVGKIANVFPGNPTRKEVEGLLDLLELSAEPLPFALQLPGIVRSAEDDAAAAAAKAEQEAAEKARVEAEQRKLVEANAKAAAEAKAQTEAIHARQAEYQRQRAAYEQGVAAAAAARAKYDADKAANDAIQADYAAKRAAYEAEMKAKGMAPR